MRFTNLNAGQLLNLQHRQDELRLSVQARQRLQWLIYLSEHRHSVSSACRHFGIARSTLHRWIIRFNPADPYSLEDHSSLLSHALPPVSEYTYSYVMQPSMAPQSLPAYGVQQVSQPLPQAPSQPLAQTPSQMQTPQVPVPLAVTQAPLSAAQPQATGQETSLLKALIITILLLAIGWMIGRFQQTQALSDAANMIHALEQQTAVQAPADISHGAASSSPAKP